MTVRVVYPKLNNRMGYAYRARVERVGDRWRAVIERRFSAGWYDYHQLRLRGDRAEAVADGTAFLDGLAHVPPAEDYIQDGTLAEAEVWHQRPWVAMPGTETWSPSTWGPLTWGLAVACVVLLALLVWFGGTMVAW